MENPEVNIPRCFSMATYKRDFAMTVPQQQKLQPDDYSSSKYLKRVVNQFSKSCCRQVAGGSTWCLKIFNLLVLVAFVTGFLVKVLELYGLYKAYPTQVTIITSYPKELEIPAVTVCNSNRLRRIEFCKPSSNNRCDNYIERVVCKLRPRVCKPGEPFLPKNYHMNSYFDVNAQWGSAYRYGHTDAIIGNCTKLIEGVKMPCGYPYVKSLVLSHDMYPNTCYTIESQHLHPNSQDTMHSSSFEYSLVLNTEPEQYGMVSIPTAIIIAVHDRKKLVNPYTEGTLLRGGIIYDTHISMTEFERLPEPYDTKCADYQELWRNNGGQGPLDKHSCTEKCKLDTLVAEGRECIPRSIAYPHSKKLCRVDEHNNVANEIVKTCLLNCVQACKEKSYHVRYSEVGNIYANCTTEWCRHSRIEVNMKFKAIMLTKYTYNPRYKTIELFSSIGGLLGLWIGMSIVGSSNVLGMICDFIYFPVWRHSRKKIHPDVLFHPQNYSQHL